MALCKIVTGATGYLGSHLLIRLLQKYPEHMMVCLARGKGSRAAADRVWQAVLTAAFDQGLVAPVQDWPERIRVFEADLCSATCALGAQEVRSINGYGPDEFWHCAASVKFVEGPEHRVWETNLGGVRSALVLADMMGAAAFNHVSTAYVAGTLTGRVMEVPAAAPPGFNNVYERSKYLAEQATDQYCRNHRMQYRVMRPSIVIGHSRTHRTSSGAGIYAVLERLQKFAATLEAKRPGHLAGRGLKVCIDCAGQLNLIPVDLAVEEMTHLAACGAATTGQAFHICSEAPVNSFAAVAVGLGLVGASRVEWVARPADLPLPDRALYRGLAPFQPYLDGRKAFDRTNVARHGADRYQRGYALTEAEVRSYARYWLECSAVARRA
jgi:nucleoside-diphosphate-sugar epimerase